MKKLLSETATFSFPETLEIQFEVLNVKLNREIKA